MGHCCHSLFCFQLVEELQDLIFEIKHALVSGSKEKLSSSKLPDKAQSLIGKF